MATYVIGDVHGQWRELARLLTRLHFCARQDRLWFVGDLVNRGPHSLEVLRFVRGLADRATVVLGNHDLHLIGRALGVARAKREDTLDAVLAAPDCKELIDWLRQQPLLFRDRGYLLVHAGLLPQWTATFAEKLAREAENTLRTRAASGLLRAYDRSTLDSWHETITKRARLIVTLNAFTRLRTCTQSGRMNLDFNGPPTEAPKNYVPWFEIPKRKARRSFILFGHWAALGFSMGNCHAGLDSACSWGKTLSALRLEDRRRFSVSYLDERRSHRRQRPIANRR